MACEKNGGRLEPLLSKVQIGVRGNLTMVKDMVLLRQIAERTAVQVMTDFKLHRISKIELEYVERVLAKSPDYPTDRASQRELVSLTMKNLVGTPS